MGEDRRGQAALLPPRRGRAGLRGALRAWPDPALPDDHPDKWLWTNTILTTQAADAIGHIHDRTPLLVPADLIDAWLDPSVEDLATVREMVAAMPKPVLRPRPVSKAVGDVRNDGPELVEPVEP